MTDKTKEALEAAEYALSRSILFKHPNSSQKDIETKALQLVQTALTTPHTSSESNVQTASMNQHADLGDDRVRGALGALNDCDYWLDKVDHGACTQEQYEIRKRNYNNACTRLHRFYKDELRNALTNTGARENHPTVNDAERVSAWKALKSCVYGGGNIGDDGKDDGGHVLIKGQIQYNEWQTIKKALQSEPGE